MKVFKLLLPYLLVILIVMISFFPFFTKNKQEEKKTEVISLWNIDGFEGGKGSRTEFLKRVANSFEKEYDSIVMVSSVSQSGYDEAITKNGLPDLLCFGSSISFSCFLPLEGFSFPPSEIEGKCYAYPWCRGSYVLYERESGSSGKIAVSSGVNNLPLLSMQAEGIEGKFDLLPSLTAYVAFLNGEYDRLLSTQRDHYRFLSRGKSFSERILSEYNDLFQYISICRGERYETCMRFIRFLLGERVQKDLSTLGLCGVFDSVQGEDSFLREMNLLRPKRVLNCFTDVNALKEKLSAGEVIKNEKMYWKTVA